jgi:hypothetical protein
MVLKTIINELKAAENKKTKEIYKLGVKNQKTKRIRRKYIKNNNKLFRRKE